MATQAPSPASSASSDTRLPTPKPVTQHEELDFFDKPGHEELARRLSRTASRVSATSARTQDPMADDFDYRTHLEYMLRKEGCSGVLRRELGVLFRDLKVTGDGSGIAYGPSMSEILTGVSRIGSAIKSMRHPARKTILQGFTGCVRPREMLLVLGRYVTFDCP